MNGDRADAQSEQNIYAGLPKCCKISSVAAQGPSPAAVFYLATFDTVVFNYGSFVVNPSGGGRYNGIYVPEPGIYEVAFQGAFSTGGETAGWLYINSALAAFPIQYTISNVANQPIMSISGLVDLKANDIVSMGSFTSVALTQLGAHQNWLSVKKEGGSY